MGEPKRFVLLDQPNGYTTLGDYQTGHKVDIPVELSRTLQDAQLSQELVDFLQDKGWPQPSLDELRRVRFYESAGHRTRIVVTPHQTTVHMRQGMSLHDACRAVPLRVYLGVYNGCNCQCSYCCAAATRNRAGFFTVQEVDRICRRLYELGVIEIRLGESGEPTQHPDFVAVVETIKRNGLHLSLNTNGVMEDGLRDFIAHSGCVDLVIQSLDGLGEAHDRNRGKDCYAQALKTIRAIHRSVKVRFNFVVNNETQHSLEDLARLGDMYNAEIYTLPMRPSGRASKGFEQYLEGLSWTEIIIRMERLRRKYPNLTLHSTYDVLTPRGDYLVDHAGSCPAGVEGCCVSPAVQDPQGGLAQVRLFGCSFMVDIVEDARGETRHPFLAHLFQDADAFCEDFFDAWQENFDVFRGPAYRDATCLECVMLREHRCTGHCAAISFHRKEHPSFDPSIYCALDASRTVGSWAIQQQ